MSISGWGRQNDNSLSGFFWVSADALHDTGTAAIQTNACFYIYVISSKTASLLFSNAQELSRLPLASDIPRVRLHGKTPRPHHLERTRSRSRVASVMLFVRHDDWTLVAPFAARPVHHGGPLLWVPEGLFGRCIEGAIARERNAAVGVVEGLAQRSRPPSL